jgi:hypothetical protein
VFQAWNGDLSKTLQKALRKHHYEPGYVGAWRVFADAQALSHAREAGLRITQRPSRWPLTASGTAFTVQNCGGG